MNTHTQGVFTELHLCEGCTWSMAVVRCTRCLDLFWCCFACTGETPETTICWPCEREQQREVPYAW